MLNDVKKKSVLRSDATAIGGQLKCWIAIFLVRSHIRFKEIMADRGFIF